MTNTHSTLWTGFRPVTLKALNVLLGGRLLAEEEAWWRNMVERWRSFQPSRRPGLAHAEATVQRIVWLREVSWLSPLAWRPLP